MFLAPSVEASPVRRALIFGGNCEAEKGKKENDFLPDMKNAASVLQKRGWDTQVLFDGNLGDCEAEDLSDRCQKRPLPLDCCRKPEGWSAKNFTEMGMDPAKVKKATRKELLDALKQAADDLDRDGGQVFLTIDTHGGEADSESAHQICMSDGLMSITDPEFVALTQRIVKNPKAHLAISDDSCFGGGTVRSLGPLLGRGACLLSAQSSNRESLLFKGLLGYLPKLLAKPQSVSLEYAYLAQLYRNDALIEQPMSSDFPLENDWADLHAYIGQMNLVKPEDEDGRSCPLPDSLLEFLHSLSSSQEVVAKALESEFRHSFRALEENFPKLRALGAAQEAASDQRKKIEFSVEVDLATLPPATRRWVSIWANNHAKRHPEDVVIQNGKLLLKKEQAVPAEGAEYEIEVMTNAISSLMPGMGRTQAKAEIADLLRKSWAQAWDNRSDSLRLAIDDSERSITELNHKIKKADEIASEAKNAYQANARALQAYSIRRRIAEGAGDRACAGFSL